ncbi:dihydrofolate reductase [Actinomyces minihominis]|uniref:dihydrofolate reductase n=1 Tax=Actinomyces minihominis TaxID=2002838 RepID=UPI000C07E392|nr:dihydrofolate reductase [Actinomyces minihominis]
MRRASIWAEDARGIIGSGTDMVWRVPADSKFFKEQTMGCPIIMGRSSFQALGRPLPGRTNIVLSRNPDFQPEGVTVAHSLAEAFQLAEEAAAEQGAETIWVTGGGDVYASTMDMVDELVVTSIDLEVPRERGLVSAPSINPELWQLVPELSDPGWRELSGDARWRVSVYQRVIPRV